jgi:hypothetical protein
VSTEGFFLFNVFGHCALKEKKVKITGMDTINVKVEFSGLSRILAKANDMQLSLSPQQTYADVVRMVAEKYPSLVGNVIDKSGTDLFPSNVFSRDGKTVVLPEQMHDSPRDGEVLICFFSIGWRIESYEEKKDVRYIMERFLHIDLKEKKHWVEQKPEEWYRSISDGVSMATRLCWENIKPAAIPIRPINPVCIANGIFAGTPVRWVENMGWHPNRPLPDSSATVCRGAGSPLPSNGLAGRGGHS